MLDLETTRSGKIRHIGAILNGRVYEKKEWAGFLQRNHNLTEVFQGKPLVDSLEEAATVIDRLNITPQTKNLWPSILQQIINSSKERGIRADELAEALFPEKEMLQAIKRFF